ncbi:PREDICTED: programmed cell death protein 4 [Ipomoea nil]|uniref:programmed cell death protein 4 n=1 Tax=Ipomoea nil TaxID=35883 RepID=UPI00090085F0|nr:PREDICTED: programmed cell death protein 4 [Ipomoea nil]
MEFRDGYMSNEHQEQLRSVSESSDPSSVSPLAVCTSPKSPWSPRDHQGRHNFNKNERNSHVQRDGRPKKGGCGGKGTCGGLLDTDNGCASEPSDPNYSSNEENEQSTSSGRTSQQQFNEYKKKVTVILQEYFENDDISSTASELRELGMPCYDFYFVKKLVSMAMDRHDKEKEMAALLLSSLYVDFIAPDQVYEGFTKLLESADDLVVDIPDTVDVLALFIARAVVDDMLPPVFLVKVTAALPENSKGLEVINKAKKSYLSAPLHAEVIERRWGGSRNRTVEDVKGKINNLLKEYVVSGDKKEAFRCVKDLNVPFFHHEIIKRAVIMIMERKPAESRLLDLLKTAAEEGLINSSQISKGFSRIIDSIDDLSLDIPNAKCILQSLISKAASEGWLSASSLKPISPDAQPGKQKAVEDDEVKRFKTKAQSIIKEYFLNGDIVEVSSCLESENCSYCPELNANFIKKLISLAMDRKKREKEMASVLLSSLCFPTEDVVNGFTMLIESADDTALDIPAAVEDLAMFLARAAVDEVLAPQHLEEIGSQLSEVNSIGNKVVQMAKSLLNARLSGERILRCWGGGGSCTNGWSIDDVKDKIGKLLEEFECGGDSREACRCIKELGMPFFHHEVVKKALVIIIEKKTDERLWSLLRDCFNMGLVTMNQMIKGFVRVAESMDDLVLDVPDARTKYKHYVERAKMEGWLDATFTAVNRAAGQQPMENGF